MYLVTRDDLPPGTQVCQTAHAAIDFAIAHPDVVAASHALIVLAAPDELTLGWLCDDTAAAGLRVVRFHEPDLGHSLTAAALEPAAHKLVSHLPLALSRRGEVRT